MSRHKRHHSTRTWKKALQHWAMAQNGPVQKNTARGATNTTDGKVENIQTGVSTSNDTKETEEKQDGNSDD